MKRIAIILISAAVIIVGCKPRMKSYAVTKFAGDGKAGYKGDGGVAISAELYYPSAIAINPANGCIFVADGNSRLRKITPDGIITTIAGNGIKDYYGDGVLASTAELGDFLKIAVDSKGNIYIVDGGRIRMIDNNSIIHTIAGDGKNASKGDGGPALNCEFFRPFAIALDSRNNIYIDDVNKVRKIDTKGIVTTIAGTGLDGYSGDGGPATSARLSSCIKSIALDMDNNIYLADVGNDRIRKINSKGIITTIVGGGLDSLQNGVSASSVRLKTIFDIALEHSGEILIAYRGTNSIYEVNKDDVINSIAGYGGRGYSGDGGLAKFAVFNGLSDIVVDDVGNIYINDAGNSCIRKLIQSNQ